MKKSILFLSLFLILAFAKAEPILLLHQEKFQPGETLIGEIKIESGNFSGELSKSNIQLYEGRRESLFDYELIKYENSYYLYSYLTKSGNFTLKIKDILYRGFSGILQSKSIEKNLTIVENPEIITEAINQAGTIFYINRTYRKILSIRPGVVFSISAPEVILENKGDKEFNITYDLDKLGESSLHKILYPGRTEKIFIPAAKQFSTLIISAYNIFSVPIIYTGKPVDLNNSISKTNLKSDHINFKIKTKQKQKLIEKLNLLNFENNTISNLKINKNLAFLTIGEYNSQIIGGGEKEINISFYSEKQGFFIDNITILFEENKIKNQIIIPVEFYVYPANASIDQINKTFEASNQTCEERGGAVCIGECDGYASMARDGWCCVGICTPDISEEDSSSGSGWIWGIVIFIFLVGGGFLLYKKVKSLKSKDPSKVIQENSSSFEKRLSGSLTRT